jgi:hypothetical protein
VLAPQPAKSEAPYLLQPVAARLLAGELPSLAATASPLAVMPRSLVVSDRQELLDRCACQRRLEKTAPDLWRSSLVPLTGLPQATLHFRQAMLLVVVQDL